MRNYSRVSTYEPTNEKSFSLGRQLSDSGDNLRSRRFQLIKGKIAGTLALVCFGTVLSIVGLYWFFIDRAGYVPFLLIGLICLIPGSYGVYEVSSMVTFSLIVLL